MRKRKQTEDRQLSLFDSKANEAILNAKTPEPPTTVLDFVRARFEHGPEMNAEEYKRWIKILINNSLHSMDK